MFNKQEKYYTVLFYVTRGVRLGRPTSQLIDDRTIDDRQSYGRRDDYVRIRVKKETTEASKKK